jgi:hypothetical protein
VDARPDPELINAIHEGGHAIAAYHLGLRVVSVSLRFCTMECPGSRAGRQKFAIASFAGPLAEARHEGKLSDREMARRWTNRWNGDLKNLLMDLDIGMLAPLHERAAALVEKHWSQIELVARELLARGSLTGAELDGLL